MCVCVSKRAGWVTGLKSLVVALLQVAAIVCIIWCGLIVFDHCYCNKIILKITILYKLNYTGMAKKKKSIWELHVSKHLAFFQQIFTKGCFLPQKLLALIQNLCMCICSVITERERERERGGGWTKGERDRQTVGMGRYFIRMLGEENGNKRENRADYVRNWYAEKTAPLCTA